MTTPPTSPAATSLGPILHLRGAAGERVRLSVTSAGPPEPPAGFSALGALGGTPFHGADLDLAREPGAGTVVLPPGLRAAVPGLPERVAVARPDAPLRVAFASCNGAEDEAAMERMPGGRGALWAGMAARHAAAPFHLLVMGGDQIYADALWDLPSMAAWGALPRRARLAAPFTEAMRAELEAHYLATYARAFAAPEAAAMLARVPCAMIWDDHDIVDGWGSRDDAWQASPVARGLFDVARRAFALVQLGLDPDAPPPAAHGFAPGTGFGWGADYGPARLVVPDLRSGRTRRRVMGEAAHAHLAGAVAGHGRPHTLVVSSVPLINADLSPVERVVAPLMPLADLYQDDLRDQWMSHAHRAEWRAVMSRLLDAAASSRVTVLSGEIHLGAHGEARRGDRRVEQIIASGIAHPPPPGALARTYEWFGRRPARRGGVAVEMRVLSPQGRRYLAERNWLEVTADPDGALRAVLHGERSGALALPLADPGRAAA